MATNDVFTIFKERASSALIDITRAVGQISNEDLAFHRSSNPSIIHLLEQQNGRLLMLARNLTRSSVSETEVTAPLLSDIDSVEDSWKSLVDIFDSLLEKADACIDEYTGAIRRLSPSHEEKTKMLVSSITKRRPDSAYRTSNIPKPQLLFGTLPTNDERTPFKPLLRSKPHAKKPLEQSLVLVSSSDGTLQYKHPYETEIKECQYPAEVYAKADPISYFPFEDTQATMVDTLESLRSMLEELELAQVIAVDLEHHDEHSFIGLVSLMQISTRGKDWIIDTLKPWRLELHALNKVFANPNILKIFHGAYMDMVWLQRDFGLYVVGLFDTFHASQSLGYPRYSLAYLLKRFANFDAAKQYQMADWRIRPLPEEMLKYARSDTHFLLYIYDNLRNELIDKSDISSADGDLMRVVLQKSKEESLQRYERPIYDMKYGMGTMGWHNLLCRTPAHFSREQFAVFRAVHQWRDTVARQEDESVHSILSKHALYNIAREIPFDMASLLASAHPISKILQKRKRDLLGVIKQVKIDGAMGPDMKRYLDTGQSNYVPHNTGVTKIEQANSAVANMIAVLARSEQSLFWGPMALEGFLLHRERPPLLSESLILVLPLPQLMAEKRQVPNDLAAAGRAMIPTDIDTQLDPQSVMNKNSKKDVIVVDQVGISKKRRFSDTQDLRQSLSSSVNDEVMKAVGKEAIDYVNAPSILHVERSSNNRSISKGSKVENPYLKCLNTRTGLQKTKSEDGGDKSLTYTG